MNAKLWILLSATLCLGGCATNRSANELASVTAANVSVVSTSLERFAQDTRVLAAERARTMQQLANRMDRSRRQLNEDVIVLRQTRADGPYKALDDLIEQSREVQLTDRQTPSQALYEAMLEDQAALHVPSESLTALSETLAALGTRRERKERVRFFVRFGNEVVDDIEQAASLLDAATRGASSNLDGQALQQLRRLSDNDDAPAN